MEKIGLGRIVGVGLFVGLILNLTGWLGNNLLLDSLWSSVQVGEGTVEWRSSLGSDVLSLIPDFVYGVAIAWLWVMVRPRVGGWVSAALLSGSFVALVGGITTYFAIANSGFIPWSLAFASFALVAVTKLPLALMGGWILERR